MATLTLSGAEANFMLDIAMSGLPSGVPMPYLTDKEGMAEALEGRGLVVRHHIGTRGVRGVLLTNSGLAVLHQLAQFRN